MAFFLVTYDLHQHRDSAWLFEAIKAVSPVWCRPTESTWIIGINSNAAAIRDHLRRVTESDASLFVTLLAAPTDGAWVGMTTEVDAWLKANL